MSTEHLQRRVTVECASFFCENLVQTTIANANKTLCECCRREAKRLENRNRKRNRRVQNPKKPGPTSSLTREQAAAIREARPFLKIREIAEIWGISETSVRRVVYGRGPEKFADAE